MKFVFGILLLVSIMPVFGQKKSLSIFQIDSIATFVDSSKTILAGSMSEGDILPYYGNFFKRMLKRKRVIGGVFETTCYHADTKKLAAVHEERTINENKYTHDYYFHNDSLILVIAKTWTRTIEQESVIGIERFYFQGKILIYRRLVKGTAQSCDLESFIEDGDKMLLQHKEDNF